MNTGGPAFPAMHFDLTENEHGMTLRDYFAAKALVCIGIPSSLNSANNWELDTSFQFAKLAYQIADAMLKARDE